MDPNFGAEVAGSFILRHILPRASHLMVALAVVAGGARMPGGDVVSAGETIIPVVVVFVRVGSGTGVVGCGGCRWYSCGCCCGWRSGVGCGVGVLAAGVITLIRLSVVAIVAWCAWRVRRVLLIRRRCCRRGRGWSVGEEGNALFCGGEGGL